MIAAEIKFDFSAGLESLGRLQEQAGLALEKAVEFLHGKCVEAVSVPNPPVKVRGRVTYPTPSRPGEPPRRRTGWGRRNIGWDVDRQRLTGTIYVHRSALYMAVLDRGTFRVAARPWLFATIQQYQAEFLRLARPAVEG